LAEFGQGAFAQFAAQAQQAGFDGLLAQTGAVGKFGDGRTVQVFAFEQRAVVCSEIGETLGQQRGQAAILGGGGACRAGPDEGGETLQQRGVAGALAASVARGVGREPPMPPRPSARSFPGPCRLP